MKNKAKGISLIILVITIIVIIILAGAVILSLSQNNPLNSANESVFKSDLKAFESDLSMYLTEKYVSTVGSYNPENLKADDLTAEYNGTIIPGVTIKNIIPVLSTTNKYDGQLEIVNGRLVYKGTDIPKKRWAEEVNLEVVNGDRLTAIISTAIGLPIAAGTNAVCTIKISSNSSIDNIDLTGNLQLLDVNSVPVVPQPVFTIAAPTGSDIDTLRNVDITIDTTTLAEGSYKLKLKARCISNIYDITNEVDLETASLFEIDNTPPTNPTMVASPTGFTNGNVLVTVSYAADSVTKQYSTNGTTWVTYTTPVVVSTNNTTVYAKAIDISGNQSGQSTITIANIDKISPTVAFGTNGGTNLQTASTTATVSDTGGSLVNSSTLQYVWDTQNTTTPVSGWTVFTNGATITKTGVTGTYYLWIKGSDNTGNSVISKSNSFGTDVTPPTNPVMAASPTGWTNGNVTVTVTYPGDATIKEYSTNGTTWLTYTAGIVVTTNSTTIYARGTDAAGNQSSQSTLTVANIDKVIPTVAFGTNGGTNLQTASTTVTVSDLGLSNLNLSTLQYVWDTQNTTTPVSGWTVFINAEAITKTGVTGTYYLWIKGSDNAGNSVISKSNGFGTDVTPPTNPVMSASPTGWTNGNVTVTVTYPGDATIKQYSTNGTTWLTYTAGVVVTTNSTTIYARGTDAAGNQSSQSTLTAANIDKVIPTVVATYRKADATAYTYDTWTNQSVTITAAGNDGSGSGINRYEITYDGSNFYALPGGTITMSSSTRTGVWVRAIDNAGNVGSLSATYIVSIDKAAPSVSYGTNGASNVLLASTTATISDPDGSSVNTGTLQYVWDTQNTTTPSSGWATFANGTTITKTGVTGTYYLWIKGSDNAGNSIVSKSNAFSIISQYTFSYTGNYQTWTVPATGKIKIEAWGAMGATPLGDVYYSGKGGYSSGELNISAGEVLYVYVGAWGVNGGWNGGGINTYIALNHSFTGGGASDIRRGGIALGNRIIVAGGGGAGGGWESRGGDGGGLIANNGTSVSVYSGNRFGSGGNQTAGGAGGTSSGGYPSGSNGTLGVGGNASAWSGSGGGGYYGGGGGTGINADDGGGGGGSSYIGGVLNGTTTIGTNTENNGRILITYIIP